MRTNGLGGLAGAANRSNGPGAGLSLVSCFFKKKLTGEIETRTSGEEFCVDQVISEQVGL